MSESLLVRRRACCWLLTLGLLLAGHYAQAQAPANDLCANAVTISCGQTLTGSTLNATSTGDPSGCCGMIARKRGSSGGCLSLIPIIP